MNIKLSQTTLTNRDSSHKVSVAELDMSKLTPCRNVWLKVNDERAVVNEKYS